MNPMSRCIWQKNRTLSTLSADSRALGRNIFRHTGHQWWLRQPEFAVLCLDTSGKNHRDKYPDKYSDARLRIHDLWTAWQILTPFFGDKTTITSQNKWNDPWHSGHSRTFRKPSPEIFRERTPILALADMASHVAGRVKNVNIQISETMMSIEDHWSR